MTAMSSGENGNETIAVWHGISRYLINAADSPALSLTSLLPPPSTPAPALALFPALSHCTLHSPACTSPCTSALHYSALLHLGRYTPLYTHFAAFGSLFLVQFSAVWFLVAVLPDFAGFVPYHLCRLHIHCGLTIRSSSGSPHLPAYYPVAWFPQHLLPLHTACIFTSGSSLNCLFFYCLLVMLAAHFACVTHDRCWVLHMPHCLTRHTVLPHFSVALLATFPALPFRFVPLPVCLRLLYRYTPVLVWFAGSTSYLFLHTDNWFLFWFSCSCHRI